MLVLVRKCPSNLPGWEIVVAGGVMKINVLPILQRCFGAGLKLL